MTKDLAWAPDEIDTNVPNSARVYDFLLGGGHNFPADRELAATIEQGMPGVRDVVRLNRAFLRRSVTFMIEAGVRQFLDIGSGIPTVGNVHEIAQQADPRCRVVYVDTEPVAVTHSQLLLQGNAGAAAIQGDLCEPADILSRPEVTGLLDLDQPVGLLMLLVWHFIPDSANPTGILSQYRDAVAPGSYLAISQATYGEKPDELRQAVQEVERKGRQQSYPRTHEEVERLFGGFELLEPGVVGCAAWRPEGPGDFSDDPTSNVRIYAGVGRKP